VVANTPKLSRNGAVGFVVWLDGFAAINALCFVCNINRRRIFQVACSRPRRVAVETPLAPVLLLPGLCRKTTIGLTSIECLDRNARLHVSGRPMCKLIPRVRRSQITLKD